VVTFDHPKVQAWLDEFAPEVIFFCGGNANYLYSKVHRLADRHGAKVVYYITDDYVLPVKTLNPVRVIDRAWTRRCFRAMCERSALVLTIGEKMSRTYEERFGVTSQTIMNLTDVASDLPASLPPSAGPVTFSYVGSLHSNRWRVLVRLAAGIERLRDRGLDAELRIYSAEQPSPKVLALLEAASSTRHCGSLDPDGVRRVIQESDVLVHVEADDAKSKTVTRLSVSTKIPEYMAAGRPIFAVGPSDVASIEYLKETASAFVVDTASSSDLDDQLAQAIQDTAQRTARAEQAWLVARENHDRATLAPALQDAIAALVRTGQRQSGGAGR
jgi:glycosyltransferase involved in cell wall biosynthesis